MPLNPDDELVQWARFGKQVELFLKSDIGSYLAKRARDEKSTAVEELIKADPMDSRTVSKWQLQARVADSILEWLGNAIDAGHSAMEQIKAEQ